jgi:hypothetical protein
MLLTRQRRIRISQIVLSAMTTAGFVGAALGTGKGAAIAGLIISTILLALNSYMKSQDLGEIAQKHRQAGSELWLIRELYQSLLADLTIGEKPMEQLLKRCDELIRQLYDVYKGAPSTNDKAYQAAQNALQNLEDMTFSDAEIDAFLPKELKVGKKA